MRRGTVHRMTHISSMSGKPSSRLAFGTMQFGGRADATASKAMFDACIEAGITHFDTAHIYTDGASEDLLGQFAKPMRDDLIIATKVAYKDGQGRLPLMRKAFDLSRKRLQMDCVDILYIHHFDAETELHETIEALAKLKDEGGFRYAGLSNFAAWQVMKAVSLGAFHDLRIDILQPMYNLVKRQAEVEILPMCADIGIEIAPYSPLGGGLLTGKYIDGTEGRLTEDERYNKRYAPAFMAEAAKGLAAIGKREGVHPATLAVAWAAAHPSGPTPIISGTSVDQLRPSLAAMDFAMGADLYAEIAALSPTPPPATDRIEEQT